MSTSEEKLFNVQLSEREMQCVANGIGAFFNVMNREKNKISEGQIMALMSAMQKFKVAISGKAAEIVVVL